MNKAMITRTGFLQIHRAIGWILLVLALAAPLAIAQESAQKPDQPQTAPCPAVDQESAGRPDEPQTAPVATGVFGDCILFGQSAALSGEAEQLGKSLQLGLQTAFAEAGEVHGRRLHLLSLDDRYEPQDALDNTRQLIEEDKVFALIGAVGTPTSRVAAPLARDAGVPYLAPFTGTESLRQPEWDNVVNLRASYFQETEEIVRHLVEDRKLKQIAVFYQDDSFGHVGYQGTSLALSKRGLEMAATAVYPRNTRAVKSGLLEIREASPQAVIIVGSYQPTAEIVAWARKLEFKPMFMTLSFVGSNALAETLGSRGAEVHVTQVVPFPWGDSPPVLKTYRKALKAFMPDAKPGFVSLEGYLAGRLVVEVLESLGPDVTRARFLAAFKDMGQIDLEGLKLSFDEDNQGSNSVYLTKIDRRGQYRLVE